MVAPGGGRAITGPVRLQLPVRPAWLLLIMAGGTAGTAVRAWLESAFAPAAGGWPWTTFWINLSGALVLGVVLTVLAESGPDRGWRRAVRLGVGTGVLGGYTTYSTFAVETLLLLHSGAWLIGVGYAVGSVVLGLAAAYAGARAVRLLARRRHKANGGHGANGGQGANRGRSAANGPGVEGGR